MSGRYWIFPLGASGSAAAFDPPIGATDSLAFAEATAFFAAQYYRVSVWVLDTTTNSWVSRGEPLRLP